MKQKVMKKHVKYIIAVLLGMVLLIAAVMGPQILFWIQDDYRMERTWQGRRNSLDMKALNSSYKGLRDRMSAFAEGISQGKNYLVTATDYKVTEELFDIIDVFFQEEAVFFEEVGLLPYNMSIGFHESGYDVEEWKKYVIYEDSFEDGISTVTAMAWYIEIISADGYRIKLLIDTENSTLYYIKFEREENENVAISISEGYEEIDFVWSDAELLYRFPLYWNSYYEADELNEKDLLKYVDVTRTTDTGEWKGLDLSFDMNYDNKGLEWEFGAGHEHQRESFYMGIKKIGDLIPEFQ